MALKARLAALEETYLRWEREGRSPFFPVIESNHGNLVDLSDQSDLLMFGSCDYLGLSQDSDVKSGAVDAIGQFGTNTYAAQLMCGYTRLHHDLESNLRELTGFPAAILLPSGMSASIASLSTIASAEDVVILDRLAHVSLFMGSRLSGAEVRTFPHNSTKRLESILRESSGQRRRIIAVDGLYSADGDYAPLDEIADLADRYDARVVVDEAHSFGSVGPNGLGVADHYGVADRIDVLVGTFSKALGSIGGFVVTSTDFERELRYMAPAYTSSRGSAPAVAGASLAALAAFARRGTELRKLLNANTEYVTTALHDADFDLLNTRSQIIPVVVGDEDKSVDVANWLRAEGILVACFTYPHVPLGSGRLRIGITSRHTANDCEYLVETLIRAKRRFAF
jgi:8-amino-7-oxononanoate synthase